MPAVPCHLNLKPNVCVISAVPLVFEPTVCATADGTDSWSTKTSTTAHKNCGSLNVDMVVAWAVVDVFVGQLSVPPQVAQTVAPQRHQQRPTQTSTANTTAAATTAALT